MNLQEELTKIQDLYIGRMQIIGKEIANFYPAYDSVILLFKDGTYAAIIGERGFEGDDVALTFGRPSLEDLRYAGILSEELYNAWVQEGLDRAKEGRRRQWVELNKEFGENPNG